MSETLERVTRLADELSLDDKERLLAHLTEALQNEKQEHKPRDLYGVWRGRVPDIDIEEPLKEIRKEWQNEWPQIFKE